MRIYWIDQMRYFELEATFNQRVRGFAGTVPIRVSGEVGVSNEGVATEIAASEIVQSDVDAATNEASLAAKSKNSRCFLS
jgi:hypothetical protein